MKTDESLWFRSINTGLHLLQDQDQQVRLKAARFTSTLHHVRKGESRRSVYLMQVNQALPLLLDLLLEECWDTPGTLEVLLCHLPQPDLRSALREASETGFVTSQDHTHLCKRSSSARLFLRCYYCSPTQGAPVCTSRTRPTCLQSPL